jgi:inhibitor of KinA sporulation pathway (predicted exonuclease)
MASKNNNIICLDLEATCWADKEEQGAHEPEIIEIGVCKLNTTSLEISDKKSILIRPEMSYYISNYCTQLTGHTWETIKHGMKLEHAFNHLQKHYGIKTKNWATWGYGDLKFINYECMHKKIKYPFSKDHMNASDWFRFFSGQKQNTSLSNALSYFGLDFIGEPHRADNDAFNTARVLKAMFELRKYYENQ